MNLFTKCFFPLLIGILITFSISAQVSSVDSLSKDRLDWYNLDFKENRILGTGVDRAYTELLKGKKAKKTIVVAVIDSGVDIDHDDLQGKIWVNEGEIPNNNLDDDNNGYIDDVNGWNFLGARNGENIRYENYEYVRIYRNWKATYGSIKNTEGLSEKEKEEYQLYKDCEKEYKKQIKKKEEEQAQLDIFAQNYVLANEIISQILPSGAKVNKKNLEKIDNDNQSVIASRDFLLSLIENNITESDINAWVKQNSDALERQLNLDFEPRKIVGDDPSDLNDLDYGNPDVKGPRPSHGTGVAGAIASIRNNGIGVDGVAEDVKIMVLRTVPNGDERDKDIALSIRYAVDNGANVINMSFGKSFSVNKKFIDEAVKYAEDKNVLLIHAAGNSASNNDVKTTYPSDKYENGKDIPHWLTIGASDSERNSEVVASFSNFGKNSVDIFAPGDDLICLDYDNSYSMSSGTSLAAPVVSGVAALVWSYYPSLSALELKNILLKSSTKIKRPKVYQPLEMETGEEKSEKVKFKTLCVSGGIINAYEALLLAEKKSK